MIFESFSRRKYERFGKTYLGTTKTDEHKAKNELVENRRLIQDEQLNRQKKRNKN